MNLSGVRNYFRGIYVEDDEQVLAFNESTFEILVRKKRPRSVQYRKVDRSSTWTKLSVPEARDFFESANVVFVPAEVALSAGLTFELVSGEKGKVFPYEALVRG